MANYMTVLLGSVNTIPDDTAVSELPRGQVDYLSHEWREEDVWRSWRSMTRLKNEITNGMRLENASWRTWWKQRNKLSTVSPETLNWLKDSDVTWLYGPLHTADYPAPTPSPKPSPNTTAALDLPMLSSSPPTTKPILKHRSIMELLTSDLPSSPMFSPPESEEDEILMHSDHEAPKHLTGPAVGGIAKRPPLTHTKSDTHISRCNLNRDCRRESPPRIIASGTPLITSEVSPTSRQGSSLDAVIVPGQKRKHISFNTFVEQCIAIEKPKKKRTVWNVEYTDSKTVGSNDYSQGYSFEDDGYDEDSEDGVIDETDELLFEDEGERPHSPSHLHTSYPRSTPSHPRSSPPPQNTSPVSSSTSEEEDEEEEEGILEMRVRHANAGAMLSPRSSSHSSSSTSSSSSRSRPPKARSAYTHRTNGSSVHHRRTTAGTLAHTASSDKELITIALIAPTILKTRAEEDEHHPYAHSHGYPHPPSSAKWYAYSAQDSPVELVYVPPSYICEDIDGVSGDGVVDMMAERYHKSLKPTQFFDGPIVASPSPDQDVPVKEVDTRRYFEQHGRVEPEAEGLESGLRYSHGGAGNVPIVQNLGRPEFVVSSEDAYGERLSRSDSRSRSRSRSHSRSRTPSPSLASIQVPPQSTAAPVPRSSSFSSPSGLLQPPDPPRGRSASTSALSSQAEGQQTRGRSVTRTSSFSDRGSESTESLGSLSPDGGFGLAIGIGGAYVGGRDRDARSDRHREGVVRIVERGRDRAGRRTQSNSESGSSLSPEDPRIPAVVTAPLPEPPKKYTSASSSSSDSSTISGVSVLTVRPPPRLVLNTAPSTQTDLTQAASASPTSVSSSSTVTPPAPTQAQAIKEEQECISRQPTPANSPILTMRPTFPSSKSCSTASSSRHDRKPSVGTSRSPTRGDDRQQGGTLVGRAVEIMSNAGAFLNSFWYSGTQASVAAP